MKITATLTTKPISLFLAAAMDVAKFQSTKAINKSKNNKENNNITQLQNKFLLYSMIVLITCCSLFCSICFPSLKVFLFQLAFPSSKSLVFLSSKFLFLVGNLIIIMVLIGESKSFSPKTPDVSGDFYFEEYISHKKTPIKISSAADGIMVPAAQEEKKDKETEKEKVPIKENGQTEKKHVKKSSPDKGFRVTGVERDENGLLPAKDLNKRADDFIARVNRQRNLEARMLLCYG